MSGSLTRFRGPVLLPVPLPALSIEQYDTRARLAPGLQLAGQHLDRRPLTSRARALQSGRESELHGVGFADHLGCLGWALRSLRVAPRVALLGVVALVLGQVTRCTT